MYITNICKLMFCLALCFALKASAATKAQTSVFENPAAKPKRPDRRPKIDFTTVRSDFDEPPVRKKAKTQAKKAECARWAKTDPALAICAPPAQPPPRKAKVTAKASPPKARSSAGDME